MEMQLPHETTVNLLLPARTVGIVPIPRLKLKNATYAKTKLVPFRGDINGHNNKREHGDKSMPIFIPRRLERREKSLMKLFNSALMSLI